MFYIFKTYYSKRYVAMNPSQNTRSCFEYTYPIVLTTFEPVLKVIFRECLYDVRPEIW